MLLNKQLFPFFRLDFDNFIVSQPESTDHICQSDQFVVSGGPPIPAICGTNTGQHCKQFKPFFTLKSLPGSRSRDPDQFQNWIIKIRQKREHYLKISGWFRRYLDDSRWFWMNLEVSGWFRRYLDDSWGIWMI